jgi:two-component system cell cycle sensor histidine kinase/response regulator CckA
MSAAPGSEYVLLVTDIVMPQMSGTDLASRARATQPGLKVLFMSGYSNRAGELAGDAVFLSKPFDEQALLSKVREALEHPAVFS